MKAEESVFNIEHLAMALQIFARFYDNDPKDAIECAQSIASFILKETEKLSIQSKSGRPKCS